ncbi:MAG: hypothetical protein CTR55_14275 [Pseudomonas sp.]|uniref:hypothetical protein n=1 Tax=Pseudomonas sp. TaxID=306 RepID=UPI000CC1A6E3|nr:hypothetical protein [Pseudomonas sp.]PJI47937.1 MAG: hypothetical protein CTR55_14275 [Pseudomonas sp.]
MSHFEQFSPILLDSTISLSGSELPQELLLSSEGNVQTFYAPFDYINTKARITICGITPGHQQAVNALSEARKQLRAGTSVEEARRKAKETASFSGPMRNNLIAMLDYIGIAKLLDIDSCARLFDTHTHLVHYTSALRYPVFINGANYSGSPSMLNHSSMRQQVETHLAEEVEALGNNCLYVPLGPKVAEALEYLQRKDLIKPEQILAGLPHPSGANAERISYFLGNKSREQLSAKTNAGVLDAARTQLCSKVSNIAAQGWH